MTLNDIIQNNLILTLNQLKADEELVTEIQKKLNTLGIYPGGRWLDGDYGDRTKAALVEFCQAKSLNNMTIGSIDSNFAETLIKIDVVTYLLESAKNRDNVFKIFLESEAGFDADKLRILDRGIDKSPFKKEIDFYPIRLQEKPDGLDVIFSNVNAKFTDFPEVGKSPTIDAGLDFLHNDVTEACICIGSFVDGQIKSHWLGKNPLKNVQFWSTTKFIPILNAVCKINSSHPSTDIDNCIVNSGGFSFFKMAVDVVTYEANFSSSNSLSAMFKRFETFSGLEKWVKNITGNAALQFRGNYSEGAFRSSPQIFDNKLNKVVLNAAPVEPTGNNLVSAYDLVRLISMLGWHHHLPQAARLPGAQWDSLESVVRAMGNDSARYVDIAIERLGLQDVIKSPVIISKLGFGPSDTRKKVELTYTVLVKFIDKRPRVLNGNPSKLRTFAMSLRAAKDLNNLSQNARELDARMAAEVTEILRRIVTEELI